MAQSWQPSRKLPIAITAATGGGGMLGLQIARAWGAKAIATTRSRDKLAALDKTREAMAAGVPVIAPAIGFLPELIEDHSTGRLMELAWESLAKILEELILDRAQVLEMGQRSLQTAVRRFAPVLQAERTLDFYHKLLANAA